LVEDAPDLESILDEGVEEDVRLLRQHHMAEAREIELLSVSGGAEFRMAGEVIQRPLELVHEGARCGWRALTEVMLDYLGDVPLGRAAEDDLALGHSSPASPMRSRSLPK
jgi:hypothetical protein